ncbi:glycoside hydrolase family 28 protein [Gaoshiqia sp. Z1-71]|uniref:glycoside hydrolase family 28 protein n=1 Tax=Gaoshiqia hydrogeniformans TaxID=3290090 RepID=UPI003BF7A510
MRKITFLFLMQCLLVFFTACNPELREKQSDPDLPFDMPKVETPAFRADTFNIVDYGALDNGTVLNTGAFAAAIDACAQAGGGVVLVPGGLWLTGPITLKSHVNLHLQSGALIQFTGDVEEYPLVESFYEGVRAIRCQSPLTGRNLENVAVTGQGIIDGNGQYWRQVKREKLTDGQWKKLVASGGIVHNDNRWYPSEGSFIGNERRELLPEEQTIENMAPFRHYLRPVMVSLVNCRKVLLEGVTFQNSPAWNVNPLMCEHITLRNLTIRNPWYSQNGDGLDLESCRIGIVENCSFDVGDDAICIKSGKDKQGRERGMPTELFIIRDCVVYHGHGGFVVGSEMSGGVRKMFVTNCTFIGTDCGLRFKSTRGRGGVVEDIYMENIRMSNIPTEAIRFNLFYASKSPSEDPLTGELLIEPAPVTEETPAFRNIYFKNIVCDGAQVALFIRGLPEMPVTGIHLENVHIKSKEGIFSQFADNIQANRIHLELDSEHAVSVYKTTNMTFTGFSAKGNTGDLVLVSGEDSRNLHFQEEEKSLN